MGGKSQLLLPFLPWQQLINRRINQRVVYIQSRNIHVVSKVKEMITIRSLLNSPNESIGFVPTMGALHDGHLSLIQKAVAQNDTVIVSIFVNPKQFSAGEDYDKYPRQLENDLRILRQNFDTKIKYLFYPSESEMYPSKPLCHIEAEDFCHIFEGQRRPDFFRGVATVVGKLFNIVRPTDSYFGQKDISQCILLQRMVQDLNMPVRVHVCESIREEDGLAMSSRNAYLSSEERAAAPVLFTALQSGKELLLQLGESDINAVYSEYVRMEIRRHLLSEPLVSHIEYISIADPSDMTESEEYKGHEYGAVISAAIKIGHTRLIDNVLVGAAEKIFNIPWK